MEAVVVVETNTMMAKILKNCNDKKSAI